MKGRISARIWTLIVVNAAVLLAVLGLAYGAGARSGGLSLRDFGQFSSIAGYEFLGALFLVVLMTLVLVSQFGYKVLKPLAELVEASDKLMSGDRSVHLSATEDDFGVIAENWNRAAELFAQADAARAADETLRHDLAELQEIAVQATRGDLSVRAATNQGELSGNAEAFNTLVETIGRRLERVRGVAADLGAAANQVLDAATEMSGSANRQEEAASGAAASIDGLIAGTRKVYMSAESAASAAGRALELSEQGTRAVRECAEGTQRIRAAMQATAAKLKSLGDRSLQIYDIINIIHETNLLALSAVLESSRGGEIGQALPVLSAELKKLSEHSRGATREIVTLLKAIQAESSEAVALMEQGNRVAEAGAQLTEDAGKSFAGIATMLRQTSELAQAISLAARQQVTGTDAVAATMQTIAAGAQENAAKGRQAAKAVEQLLRTSEQLAQPLGQLRSVAGPAVVKPEKSEAAKPEKSEAPTPVTHN